MSYEDDVRAAWARRDAEHAANSRVILATRAANAAARNPNVISHLMVGAGMPVSAAQPSPLLASGPVDLTTSLAPWNDYGQTKNDGRGEESLASKDGCGHGGKEGKLARKIYWDEEPPKAKRKAKVKKRRRKK